MEQVGAREVWALGKRQRVPFGVEVSRLCGVNQPSVRYTSVTWPARHVRASGGQGASCT